MASKKPSNKTAKKAPAQANPAETATMNIEALLRVEGMVEQAQELGQMAEAELAQKASLAKSAGGLIDVLKKMNLRGTNDTKRQSFIPILTRIQSSLQKDIDPNDPGSYVNLVGQFGNLSQDIGAVMTIADDLKTRATVHETGKMVVRWSQELKKTLNQAIGDVTNDIQKINQQIDATQRQRKEFQREFKDAKEKLARGEKIEQDKPFDPRTVEWLDQREKRLGKKLEQEQEYLDHSNKVLLMLEEGTDPSKAFMEHDKFLNNTIGKYRERALTYSVMFDEGETIANHLKRVLPTLKLSQRGELSTFEATLQNHSDNYTPNSIPEIANALGQIATMALNQLDLAREKGQVTPEEFTELKTQLQEKEQELTQAQKDLSIYSALGGADAFEAAMDAQSTLRELGNVEQLKENAAGFEAAQQAQAEAEDAITDFLGSAANMAPYSRKLDLKDDEEPQLDDILQAMTFYKQ